MASLYSVMLQHYARCFRTSIIGTWQLSILIGMKHSRYPFDTYSALELFHIEFFPCSIPLASLDSIQELLLHH
ncbi:hypothetical protein C4D60_Mb04t09870 [Musa balbisiana]|uniref:Uncharacterized protein n=1 Tax=Musa balbisiana TaxID=52838 RepID=A0A4S8KB15_MUSBA|nr:hypothetical protein C4D60_Mb04t09870 [Musa balbisiana]